jgi:hypothetical protein
VQADRRARLAEAQAELIRGLVGRGCPPVGFARSRITAASDALLAKRAGGVANSWPMMAHALGEGFHARFARYAQENQLPRQGGPLADGRLFARALVCAREFPEEARLEMLAFDARYAAREDGFVLRRGFCIKAAMLERPLRLVLVIFSSWTGERWFKFKLPFSA